MLPDYIVLAHNRPERVARLVDRLTGDGNQVWLHYDVKAPDADLLPKVQMVRRRSGAWGRYGIVAAAVEALRAAVAADTGRHVVLLSGSDYPVKPNDDIAEHFAASTASHWETWPIPRPGWAYAGGVGRYDRWHWGPRYPIPPARLVPAGKGPRRMPAGLAPHGGWQWFSLHPEHAAAIVEFLDDHRQVERFFRWTHLPDEMMLQSVARTVGVDLGGPVHYVDWSTGGRHPRELGAQDAAELMAGPALYARKFVTDDGPDEIDRLMR